MSDEKARERQAMLNQINSLVGQGATIQEACAKAHVTRSQFCKWRARRNEDAPNGLRDRSRRPPTHRNNIPADARARVLTLALEFRQEGCLLLKRRLQAEGFSLSITTVQNILMAAGMNGRECRSTAADQDCRLHIHKLSPLRIDSNKTRKYSRFRARSKPGQLVIQSFYSVPVPPKWGKLYLHFLCDVATEQVWFDLSWAHGVDGVAQARDAVALLENGAVAAFREHGVRIRTIVTSSHAVFTGGSASTSDTESVVIQPTNYQMALRTAGLKHKPVKALDEKRWKKNPALFTLLKRLKTEFPDSDTRKQLIRKRKAQLLA